VVKIEPPEVTVIADKLGAFLGYPRGTTINAIAELIRKGGANNNTPPAFSVAIFCPVEKKNN
jgi:hypothetical protein